MRVTLEIDDDILAAAQQLARRDQKTVGEVISALARQGLSQGGRPPRAERNGIPLLLSHRGAAPVTLELVNPLRDGMP